MVYAAAYYPSSKENQLKKMSFAGMRLTQIGDYNSKNHNNFRF